MTKTDLVARIADKTGLTRKDSAAALEVALAAITDTLAKGDNLALSGFGTFAVSERAAREGKNPGTGETIQIKAAKVVKFRPGKALRDGVN